MPTPPPDIDVELWRDSLDRLGGERPGRLALTHFGAVDDVADHLDRARRSLDRWAEEARELDGERFIAALHEATAAESRPGEAERYEHAAPAWQLHLGLERYWRGRGGS
jgi:hypothetical protein